MVQGDVWLMMNDSFHCDSRCWCGGRHGARGLPPLITLCVFSRVIYCSMALRRAWLGVTLVVSSLKPVKGLVSDPVAGNVKGSGDEVRGKWC